ncbi:hypothetical protein LO749_01650 [Paracoccus denitrificans]|uniref:hypothetical protein n=1 Tax=Paracoccus denitrificans TaxID=266 RepID=UPI001E2D6003|nr:hypothetical protein [Paracoccus denitrificans]UFS65300.1 hypothetical protein LO749_01650 [Paracoccus denitrificans]
MTTAPTPWPKEISRRRADVEAEMIALRDALPRDLDANVLVTRRFWPDECYPEDGTGHGDGLAMDHIPVPVHDFAPGGDPFVIYGVPEADGPGSGRRPIAWGAVFIWIWVVAVVLFGLGLGWMIGQLDGKTMLDLLSPTAVQAREAGWVSLSEGL